MSPRVLLPALRARRFRIGCAALVAALALGCSGDDPPTEPAPVSGSWQDLGLTATQFTVNVLTSWNGLLVVGGEFHYFQAYPFSNVLAWDGVAWTRLEPLGLGSVHALAVHEGDLIAGGEFSVTQGDTLPSVARWDGTQWIPLGSELEGETITALAVYEGDLIAGVLSEQSFGSATSYVARWNGSSWSPMGGAMNGMIHAMTVSQGILYVGGSFDTAEGLPAMRVAAWNGAMWSSVGGGVSGETDSVGLVLALTSDGTTLVAGGDFRTAGGVPAFDVARWNGAVWDSLGGGFHHAGGIVEALTLYDGTPVAGGVLGGNQVQRWSGSEWIPMSMSRLDGIVTDLTVHDGRLIAGGHFPPGGKAVVRWVP